MIPIIIPIILAIENEQDKSFVEQLYIENHNKIYRIAYNILKKHEDAEDCMQDVFERIIRHLDRFQSMTKEHQNNALGIMTRNRAIDIQKQLLKKHSKEVCETWNGEEESDILQMIAEEESVVEAIINEENKKILSKFIDELDPIYQDVIVLHYNLNLTNSEICDMLGISKYLVSMRLNRAKSILRKKMEEIGYEE